MDVPSRHDWQARTARNGRGNTVHYASCRCGCQQSGSFQDTREQAERDAERMQREDRSL